MPLETDEEIAALLRTTKTIGLKIASPKPHRDSNKILRFLVEQGYDVYPVNPGHAGEEISGCKVYATLEDIPVNLDMVDIFRRSSDAGAIIDRAIALGIKSIWMQLGVIDEAAATRAETAGLKVVMNCCPAIEIPRLRRKSLL